MFLRNPQFYEKDLAVIENIVYSSSEKSLHAEDAIFS